MITSSFPIAPTNEASLNLARFASAARRISLFFADTPDFRQRSFSVAITEYSTFGMVKLSRTCLAFFTLAGFAAPVFLLPKGTALLIALVPVVDPFAEAARLTRFAAVAGLRFAAGARRFLAADEAETLATLDLLGLAEVPWRLWLPEVFRLF